MVLFNILSNKYRFLHNLINKRLLSTLNEPLTRIEFNNGIKIITMCSDKTRNSLSIDMMTNLIDNITNDESNPNLRVIILTAEGKVFSAGHNLKELSVDKGQEQHEKVFKIASKLMYSIIDSPVSIIARVDGLAAAAGCQLVAQCDIALCTTKSTFSTPGANFGVFCSTPGIALSRCIPKMMAMNMLLTGQPINSNEAKSNGLVIKVCDNTKDLDNEIELISNLIKTKSRKIIEIGKQFYYKQIQNDIKTAYQLGEKQMVDNLQLVDGQEGINSFMEKRKPQWKH